jgi:hemolysin activation/secretion protein
VRVSQGLQFLGASQNSSKQLPRLHEQVNFTKVNGELDRTTTLFPVGNFGTALLKVAAAGQYSSSILPPEEKFYLGGPHFDRGFYYGQVTGDKALAATIEPLFDKPLPSISFLPSPLSSEFYGFYDWGEVWQNQSLDAGHLLRSAGGGVRLYIGPQLEMDFEGVARFTTRPSGASPGVSALASSAFYWQLIDRF